ncbi:MAG TPA: hypothetical protein VK928_03130 [Longimicrobiales bacterium]|nr:hypothetical protein [Longimicrobiales bacterium]
MGTTIRRLRGVTALCVILLGACGGLRQGTDTVEVMVNNDLLPSTAVTVWMVPESGARRQLGTVAPMTTKTFAFSPTGATGQYRLVAEHVGGGSTQSGSVILTGLSGIHWNLTNPAVHVTRR